MVGQVIHAAVAYHALNKRGFAAAPAAVNHSQSAARRRRSGSVWAYGYGGGYAPCQPLAGNSKPPAMPAAGLARRAAAALLRRRLPGQRAGNYFPMAAEVRADTFKQPVIFQLS